MKYASYIISWIAVVLLFNIFLSYSSLTYRGFLKDTKDKMLWVSKTDVIEKLSKDQVEINTKILNSIDKLNENIDKLNKDTKHTNWLILTASWELISSWETSQSAQTLEMPTTLVTKLLPKINPLKVTNNWVFDIKNSKIFDDLKYITFSDSNKRIKIYIFNDSYDEIKKLFKLNSKFSVNESDNFFWFSFYLNPLKKDLKIRFVTQIEWKAVWFDLYKNNYELLKENLLN